MRNKYIEKSKEFCKLGEEEIIKSKKTKNLNFAIDGCAKGYLALELATKGLFLKKGVNPKAMPKTYRGTLYFLQKYADRDLRRIFHSARQVLHIDGYHEQIIDYKRLNETFSDLKEYIMQIENI